MKLWASVSLLALALSVGAQTPEVSIVTDLRWSAQFDKDTQSGRLYDPFGRVSAVTLQLILEGAFLIRVSQRFVRIPSDELGQPLEFATFEWPGLWRVGFVDAKFGSGRWFTEHGLGGEITTRLLFDDLPIRIAAIDGGPDRSRAVVARLGSRVGVSYASGTLLSATASSLNNIRRPEQSTGRGRGYREAYGVDGFFTKGHYRADLELIGLRQGESNVDREEWIVDAQVTYRRALTEPEFKIGYARTLKGRSDHIRFEVEAPIDPKVSATAQARWDRGQALIALGFRARF